MRGSLQGDGDGHKHWRPQPSTLACPLTSASAPAGQTSGLAQRLSVPRRTAGQVRHSSIARPSTFISGSPDYLVHKMAVRYGVADCMGTRYLLDENDRYTGEIEQMWDSDSKNEAVAHFVRKYNIDLSLSYAYGDTNGDLSMFELVGNPIAINPTRELLTHLTERDDLRDKVKIVVERKDVVYLLDPTVQTFRAYPE